MTYSNNLLLADRKIKRQHTNTKLYIKYLDTVSTNSPIYLSLKLQLVLLNALNLGSILYKNPFIIIKAIKLLFLHGPFKVLKKLKSYENRFANSKNINQQYQLWLKKNYPNKIRLRIQKKRSHSFQYQPLISIITPTYNPSKKAFIDYFNSLLNQSYYNWELCIVDDASTNLEVRNIIKKYAKKDKRIKFLICNSNGHICKASNDALNMAHGEFVGFVDHDDMLWPNALFEIVNFLNSNSYTQFIYTDEDKLSEDGELHSDPFFKPDWSPDYLRSINYITHFTVIKKSLISKVGNFQKGFEGAQDWDLFLRVSRYLEKEGHCNPLDEKNPIQHISKILYSWRKTKESTSSADSNDYSKKYALDHQKKVLTDDLNQRNISGKIISTQYLGIWRMKYDTKDKPLISIIIPSKDQLKYISRCINSILKKTTYKNYKIIIVDTGSTDKKVFQFYEQIKKQSPRLFRVLNWRKQFNFAAVCNFGAKKSKGNYILFLNNDTEVITPDWIESMLEYAQRDQIGAVGCKLLYPNNQIQHAGVVLGMGAKKGIGVAGHFYKQINDNSNYVNHVIYTETARNISAVTAACLMINKEKYFEVQGQDSRFKIAFNDVDLCMKLQDKNYLNIYLGYVKLFHHESVSIGKPGTSKKRSVRLFKNEIQLMKKKWKSRLLKDHYYNENLSLDSEGYNLKI